MGRFSPQSKLSRFSKAFWGFFAVPQSADKNFRLSFIRNHKGSALVMAAIFMLVAVTLITVGVKLASNARSQTKTQAVVMAEAEDAARAGLIDALGWFRRQNTQPVAATTLFGATPQPTPTFTAPISFVDQVFNPIYNTSNPSATDTLDGSMTIGIVNEFSPDGAGSVSEATTIGDQVVWERYEVQRQLGSSTTLMTNAAHDISGERVDQAFNGQGLVWYVQSTGYVYQRHDYTKSATGPTTWATPYNMLPNRIMAKAIMGTEFRKMSLNKPFGVGAALYCKDITKVNLNSGNNSVLSNGGKSGTFAWASANNSGAAPSGGTTTNVQVGAPVSCAGTGNFTSLIDSKVFGMSLKDVQSIADVIGNASTTINFAGMTAGSYQLIYYGGNLTIDPASAVTQYQSINGSGILVVNGDLTMTSSGTTFSAFSGLIYVSGNFTNNGCLINGSVIMGYTGGSASSGNVTITGTGAYHGSITYNPSIFTYLQANVAQYREDTSARHTLLAVPNL
jgi:hypothetical protein